MQFSKNIEEGLKFHGYFSDFLWEYLELLDSRLENRRCTYGKLVLLQKLRGINFAGIRLLKNLCSINQIFDFSNPSFIFYFD